MKKRKQLLCGVLSAVMMVSSVPGMMGIRDSYAQKVEREDILVHYDMSAEGEVLKDISGNGYDAKLVRLNDSNVGKDGDKKTLCFEGGGYVELPDFIQDNEKIRIEITYKVGTKENEGLLAFGTKGTEHYLRFHPNVDSKFMWESAMSGSSGYQIATGEIQYSEDNYTTASVEIKSDGTLNYFIDGNYKGNLDMNGASLQKILNAGTDRGGIIGSIGKPVWEGDPYFSGTLEDFIVYGIAEEAEVPVSTNKKVISTTYPTKKGGHNFWWRDCMITGNGENGALVAGSPLSDTIIYQYMMFNMPTNDLRDTPDLSGDLEAARQDLIKGNVPETDWNMQYDYTFHPGHQLSLDFKENGSVRDYYRWTDYETAEVGVNYTDDSGTWERRTFASREDNVVITYITPSSLDRKIDLNVTIDGIEGMNWENAEINKNLRYKQLVSDDGSYIGQVAHYPVYTESEIQEGGFAGITYVVTKGGTKEAYEIGKMEGDLAASDSSFYGIRISEADEVFLITQSDRDLEMGSMEEFDGQEEFLVVDELKKNLEYVIQKNEYQSDGFLDYDAMLEPHKEKHGTEFKKIKLNVANSNQDTALSNEELIRKQQNNGGGLNTAMTERAFYAGRYAALCSSGYSTPRLGGMWTGAWNGNWQADWTTDANVNLQIAGANIGALESEIQGFINFILRMVPDWEANASAIYGMEDAIMAPPRTDGERSSIVHFNNDYPFHYWNAGASWLLEPIYEYWTCYGDVQVPIGDDIELASLKSVLSVSEEDLSDEAMEEIENRGYFMLAEDILLPLLTKQANFWEQLTDPRYYEDENGLARFTPEQTELGEGERYLLLPSYSPENKPQGWGSSVTINSSMDIAAARDGLKMIMSIEEYMGREESEEAIARWDGLYEKLPEVKYDETGALREWSLKNYTENHGHRHISQAYFAWPAHESQNSTEMANGLETAVKLRKSNAGDKKSGHGWLHTGLVDARLKNADGITDALMELLSNQAYYSSFTTNHNITGDSTYCTDILITVPALILESLAYSNRGKVEILPALPDGMETGSVEGIMARTEAEIQSLSWNLKEQKAEVVLKSNVDQELELSCGIPWNSAQVTSGGSSETVVDGNQVTLSMTEGELVKVEFELLDLNSETVKIISDSDQALTVTGIENEAPIRLEGSETKDAGLWNLEFEAARTFRIRNIQSGRQLAFDDSDKLIQTNDGQLWTLEEKGKGRYLIRVMGEEKAISQFENQLILSESEDAIRFAFTSQEKRLPRTVMSDLSIRTKRSEVAVGSAMQMGIESSPASGIYQGIEWISSDPDIVTVEDGMVIGREIGTATITATGIVDQISDQVEITVTKGLKEVLEEDSSILLLKGNQFGREENEWERDNGPGKAFDDSASTCYDGQDGAYVGIDTESQYILKGFRIVDREHYTDRLFGNWIEVSNDGKTWHSVYEIRNLPVEGENGLELYIPEEESNGLLSEPWRFFRVSSGSSSYCNIAEVQFYGAVDDKEPDVEDTYTVGIKVIEKPGKTEYETGDEFEPAGMKVVAYVKASASDASRQKVLAEDEYEVEYDFGAPEMNTVTVVYSAENQDGEEEEFTDSFQVKVYEPLTEYYTTGIGVTKRPDKMEYEVEDEFEPDGMKVVAYVKASGSNASRQKVLSEDDYEIAYDFGTAGRKTVTVSYCAENKLGEEEEFTYSFRVKVSEPWSEPYTVGIEITKTPHKMKYEVGDELEPKGMEVVAYEKASASDASRPKGLSEDDYDITYDFSTPGTKKVTVIYEALGELGEKKKFTDSFNVSLIRHNTSNNGGNGGHVSNQKDDSISGTWQGGQKEPWKFRKSDGIYAANEWAKIKGIWYYFDMDGKMQVDWINIRGKWYFLKADGSMACNEWYYDNSFWYYLGNDGDMFVGGISPDGFRVDKDGHWIP